MKPSGTSALITATVLVAALAGCGSNSAGTSIASGAGGGSDKVRIGVSVADQKSLFYIAEVDGIKAAAEKEGVEIVLLSADNNSTQQVNQVNDLITQGVDALIFTAQDATAAAEFATIFVAAQSYFTGARGLFYL